MSKVDGPVLITFRHGNLDDAKKVIEALHARGIKKGDLIAFELTNIQLDNLVGRWLARKLRAPIETAKDGETIFIEKVFDFLMQKDVNIFPFASEAVEKHVIDRLEKHDNLGKSGKKVSRKERRLTGFMMLPIREKFFRKRLRGQAPKFVLGGSLHRPFLKKAFPYREIVDVGKPPLKLRLSAQTLRLHYNAIKRYTRAKRRRMLQKRRLAGK